MGTLLDLRPQRQPEGLRATALGALSPVGSTDSELAFCHILDTLAALSAGKPAPAELHAALRGFAREIGSRGEFNFLLSDGDWLFAHCSSRLCYIVRRAPFAEAHLADEDLTVDFRRPSPVRQDRVAVIATTPLTDNEHWTQIAPATWSPSAMATRSRSGKPPPWAAGLPAPGHQARSA